MPRPTDPALAARLGKRLREARRDAGLTQEQVCERAGIPVETLSRAESGRLVPFVGTLARVARALELGLSELIDPDGPPPVALTDDERRLVRLYRALGPRRRGALLALLADEPNDADRVVAHEPAAR